MVQNVSTFLDAIEIIFLCTRCMYKAKLCLCIMLLISAAAAPTLSYQAVKFICCTFAFGIKLVFSTCRVKINHVYHKVMFANIIGKLVSIQSFSTLL